MNFVSVFSKFIPHGSTSKYISNNHDPYSSSLSLRKGDKKADNKKFDKILHI
jgi:hypothetical protein